MNLQSLSNLVGNSKFSNTPYLLYQEKAYYGNVCHECFVSKSLKHLRKCAACKTVAYCEREHQVQNWPEHKKLCRNLEIANEKLDAVKNCSFEDFTKFRENQMSELKTYGKFAEQVSQLPWVCSVCYSRENLIECEKCESVVYCGLEHKQLDYDHKFHCHNLKMCRVFDSLSHKNGFQLQLRKFVVEIIPRYVKDFPENMYELSFLIQKQIKRFDTDDMQSLINFYIHNDIYSPSSSILYALDRIELLQNRVFIKKPFLSPSDRQDRLAERMAEKIALKLKKNNKTNFPEPLKPAMIMHIIGATNYEINFAWTAFVGFSTQWMFNIDFIEFVLIGEALKDCGEPDFSLLEARSSFQCHPKPYVNVVKKLISPDLIVLFNYGYNEEKTIEFDDYETQMALFKYEDIPVIITSTKEQLLIDFVEKLKRIPGVQVLLNTHLNPFAESRPFRIWDQKSVSTYVRNKYLAVLTRR